MGKPSFEADARRAREELRLLKAQRDVYRKRMAEAREMLAEAVSALDSASYAIVTEEAKKNLFLAVNRIQRWIDRDDSFAAMDCL